jgi:hypothetical protein
MEREDLKFRIVVMACGALSVLLAALALGGNTLTLQNAVAPVLLDFAVF